MLYAPVRITGIIENVGNSTAAVSLTDGWGFELRNGNEFLPLRSDWQYDVGEHVVVILSPGEKYYISEYMDRMNQLLTKREFTNCDRSFGFGTMYPFIYQ